MRLNITESIGVDEDSLKRLRDKYKTGVNIYIDNMEGEPRYCGKMGEVTNVDDAGQVHGTWGGCALIPGTDTFHIVDSADISVETPVVESIDLDEAIDDSKLADLYHFLTTDDEEEMIESVSLDEKHGFYKGDKKHDWVRTDKRAGAFDNTGGSNEFVITAVDNGEEFEKTIVADSEKQAINIFNKNYFGEIISIDNLNSELAFECNKVDNSNLDEGLSAEDTETCVSVCKEVESPYILELLNNESTGEWIVTISREDEPEAILEKISLSEITGCEYNEALDYFRNNIDDFLFNVAEEV